MIKHPNIPTLADPQLLDLVLLEIRTKLAAQLTWVDNAYGKARLQRTVEQGREVKVPTVYIGQKDYMELLPDQHNGNTFFFDVEDGQDIVQIGVKVWEYKAKVGFVLWFNLRDIYPDDWQESSIENVKREVVNAFQGLRLVNSVLRIRKIWENSDNVYKGYTHKELKTQHRMHPFGTIRVDFEMKYNDKVC